jgi:hypothetical protein
MQASWEDEDHQNRPILIDPMNLEDKFKLLRESVITDREIQCQTRNYDKYIAEEYERIHHQFCKFALNVSKFASNSACMFELGRYPLYIKALKLCVKYLSRMEKNETKNVLLTHAFKVCKAEKHSWYEGLANMLRCNGLGDLANSTTQTTTQIANSVQQRLKDQFLQGWSFRCRTDYNLGLLDKLHNDYNSPLNSFLAYTISKIGH